MKLTVLIDNNTLIDRRFLGEPGVSHFIKADGKKILFDVGCSDAFILNARKLSIDLLDVDLVVLSHGHLDHTWGLFPLVCLCTETIFEGKKVKKPTLVTYPLTLASKWFGDLPEIGSTPTEDKLARFFRLELSRKPVHACHCTDLKSKIALAKVVNLKEVGVGLILHYK